MKKTTFSLETDRYRTKQPDSRHELVYATRYTSDGLEDCHLMLNTYADPDAGSFPSDATLITLTRRDALLFAQEILNLYA